MSGAPFTLPKDPVDRYEVKWYELDLYSFTIAECRAVYHVNSSWKEVVGDDGPRDGAPFVNHWQVFRRDVFTGRSSRGWAEAWAGFDWTNDYATPKAARLALRKALLKAIENLENEASDLRGKLEALDEEAWAEWEKAHPE